MTELYVPDVNEFVKFLNTLVKLLSKFKKNMVKKTNSSTDLNLFY